MRSTSLGWASKATAYAATALGQKASATGYESTALGSYAAAKGWESVAIDGGASIDAASGTVTGPTYNVQGGAHNTVDEAFTSLDTATTQNTNDINTLNTDMADAVKYDNAAHDQLTLGKSGTPVAVTNVKDAVLAQDSTDAVNGGQLHATNENVSQNTGNITKNTGDITNLTNNISNGALGLVQQDASTKHITVAKDKDGDNVSFAGTAGERMLSGVKAGVTATDAVNLSQLTPTINALGGGASIDAATGNVTGPTYNVQGSTHNTVGSAMDVLDNGITKNAGDINNLNTTVNNINTSIGDIGNMVKYDSAAHDQLTLGKANTPVKMTNVADATLTDNSKDAVNGSQLHATNQKVSTLDNIALKYDDIGKSSVTLNKGGAAAQIKNVADGNADTDAVNIRQLKSSGLFNQDGSANNVVTYSDNHRHTVVLGGAAGAIITNLNPGRIETGSKDAVNGGQIKSLQDRLDSRIDGLDTSVTHIESNSNTNNGTNTLFAGDGDQATQQALASGSHSTVVGANATASADNSVAIGVDSVADRNNTVSVGTAGNERAIANVMAGTADTDAVNVKQLNGIANDVKNDMQNLRNDVEFRMQKQDRRIDNLGALSSAMTGMTANVSGLKTEHRLGVGTGVYNGQVALAIGYQRRLGDRMTVSVGVASTGSETTANAGLGIRW